MQVTITAACMVEGCNRDTISVLTCCEEHRELHDSMIYTTCLVCKYPFAFEQHCCPECYKLALWKRGHAIAEFGYNDKTLLAALEELHSYRELGSYELLAHLRSQYDIEEHCTELGI